MTKPTLPQGTRDFGPETVRKRNYILDTIRRVFERYGFEPLETPAMENLDTLMGKYGEEGDKLIFKILNNGLEQPSKQVQARTDFEAMLQGRNVPGLTERALKYDLTIPFARYVAMNHGQLTLPFRRYQIQPVWRADKPQKGRYREFTQCDADVVGSTSILNEVELSWIYHKVMTKLGLGATTATGAPGLTAHHGYELRINSRKVLAALAEACGSPLTDVTVAIDKLDKIGLEKVKDELKQRGLDASQVSVVEQFLAISGSNAEKLSQAVELLPGAEAGLAELRRLLDWLPAAGPNVAAGPNIIIDFTLARGLNYYTGIIFEVKAPPEVKIGSIGGGGRYDDLTGLFGVPNIPGVGISLGVDRIYDVLEALRLFPADVAVGTQVLFFNLGETESRAAFQILQSLRAAGIRGELYHETAKFDKQFKYAERKRIPYVVIIGSEEMKNGTCVIRSLETRTQETLPQASLEKRLINLHTQ